jgi:hypothetical protein
VLHAILEEAKGAIVKVQQHAHTTTLGVTACPITEALAVAEEGAIVRIHEPAIGAGMTQVAPFEIKAGPADADAGGAHIYRKQLHFPVVLALH